MNDRTVCPHCLRNGIYQSVRSVRALPEGVTFHCVFHGVGGLLYDRMTYEDRLALMIPEERREEVKA